MIDKKANYVMSVVTLVDIGIMSPNVDGNYCISLSYHYKEKEVAMM